MITRKMKISYKAERSFASAVPFLRIGNRYLRDIAKMNIGDAVEVHYSENTVVIRKSVSV